MKNRFKISALCIGILLSALGCGTSAENEEPLKESVEPAAVTVSDQEEQTESDDYFEETTKDTEGSNVEESEDYDSSSVEPASGCDPDIENQGPSEESMEPAAETDIDQKEQTELHAYYEELITTAKECIEGKVEEEYEDYDFSYIIYRYGAHYGASLRLGYLIKDIDGNGTDELIFGQNDDPDSAWDGVIYDLYTISDGKLIHVFDGGERSTYHLCENGMIANEGADGAAMSVYAYYNFEGTELNLAEAVLYNGWEDSDNPWFYSTETDSYYDTENLESISGEQAWTIIEKYVYERPTFIPFVEE